MSKLCVISISNPYLLFFVELHDSFPMRLFFQSVYLTGLSHFKIVAKENGDVFQAERKLSAGFNRKKV